MKTSVFLPILCSAIIAIGCGKKSENKKSTNKVAGKNFLLTGALQVAPTISGTASTSLSLIPQSPSDCTTTYGYMCLGWEFFTLLRKYDPANNNPSNMEDKIASENLFKNLETAGQIYLMGLSKVEALPAAKEIASPFDFGSTNITGLTFSKAKNGIVLDNGHTVNLAINDDGTTKSLLFTSIGAGASEGMRLIGQSRYTESTGDIELNMIWLSKYPDGGSMNGQTAMMRTHIKGNEKTHFFEFQGGGTNNGSGPSYWNWSSIEGAGYSQGADHHYLVFYRGTNASSDPNHVQGVGTTGGYFCMPADTTKATFGATVYAKPLGYAEGEVPANCAAYLDTIKGMTKWQITNTTTTTPTTTDYPYTLDSSLFTGNGSSKLELSF